MTTLTARRLLHAFGMTTLIGPPVPFIQQTGHADETFRDAAQAHCGRRWPAKAEVAATCRCHGKEAGS
jgi:hypothetical protein